MWAPAIGSVQTGTGLWSWMFPPTTKIKKKNTKKRSKKPIQIRGPNNTTGSGPTKTNPNRSAPVITHCLYDHKYNNPSGGRHIDVGKKIWSVRHTMRILWRQTYKSINCWAHIRNSIRSKFMSHLSGLGQITLFEVSPNKLLGMKNHIFSTWSTYLGSFTSDTDPVLILVFMSRAFFKKYIGKIIGMFLKLILKKCKINK